jgi:hypothetical protein
VPRARPGGRQATVLDDEAPTAVETLPEFEGAEEIGDESLPNLESAEEIGDEAFHRRSPKKQSSESTVSRGLGGAALDPTGLEEAGVDELSIAPVPGDIDLSDFADLPDTHLSDIDQVEDELDDIITRIDDDKA